MQTLGLQIKGTAPLLMHNVQMANPLSIYAKTMKPLTSKRNKTDADFEQLARMDWEAALYLKNGGVVIPARCVEKCLIQGARKAKQGKKIESGVLMADDFCELEYAGKKIKIKPTKNVMFPNSELNKFYDLHRNQQMVKVGTAMVLRTRPIFYDWSFLAMFDYDESVLDERTLLESMQVAGKLIGLLEQRPRLGRFVVDVVK